MCMVQVLANNCLKKKIILFLSHYFYLLRLVLDKISFVAYLLDFERSSHWLVTQCFFRLDFLSVSHMKNLVGALFLSRIVPFYFSPTKLAHGIRILFLLLQMKREPLLVLHELFAFCFLLFLLFLFVFFLRIQASRRVGRFMPCMLISCKCLYSNFFFCCECFWFIFSPIHLI